MYHFAGIFVIGLAHIDDGRLARRNVFEGMFRVVIDDDFDLAPRVKSLEKSSNILHLYRGMICFATTLASGSV